LSRLCSALSAPEVAKIDGDELLTMEEILGLRLNAEWVVLSACNTANGAGTGAKALGTRARVFAFRFAHPIFWAPCALVGDVG
jgi:CHAT domain-containing protein